MGSRLNISTFSYIQKAYQEGIYADTPSNRKLGRVGMTYKAYESLSKNERNNKNADMPFYEIFNGYKHMGNNIWKKIIKDDSLGLGENLTLSDYYDKQSKLEYRLSDVNHGIFYSSFKTDKEILELKEEKIRLQSDIDKIKSVIDKYNNNSEYWESLTDVKIGKKSVDPSIAKEKLKRILLEKEQHILDISRNNFEIGFCCDPEGNAIFSKSGERSYIQLSEEESLLLKSNIFTHNHPSSNCFSWQDIALTLVRRLKQMRAIVVDAEDYGKGAFVLENLQHEDAQGEIRSALKIEFEINAIHDQVYQEFSTFLEKEMNKHRFKNEGEEGYWPSKKYNDLYDSMSKSTWTETTRRFVQLPKYKNSLKFYFEDEKGNRKEIKEKKFTTI